MTTSYLSTWVHPHRMSQSWSPAFFDPKFENIDSRIEQSPEQYIHLREFVRISQLSPDKEIQNSSASYAMVLSGTQITVEEVGDQLKKGEWYRLPAEAILVASFAHEGHLKVGYWNEAICLGRGVAPAYMFLIEPMRNEPIAWLLQELKSNFVSLQIQRALIGSFMSKLTNEKLSSICISILPEAQRAALNEMVINKTRSHIALGRLRRRYEEGRGSIRPFLLTGATFRERLAQFEKYLAEQPIFDGHACFFIEASTEDKKADLFVVRPISPDTESSISEATISIKGQKDKSAEEEWKAWYWGLSNTMQTGIFNSTTADQVLPPYLQTRMISHLSTSSFPLSLLPSFNWYRSFLEGIAFFEDEAADLLDSKAVLESWIALNQGIDPRYHKKLITRLGMEGVELDDTLTGPEDIALSLHSWLDDVFRPAVGIRVQDKGRTVGAFILFSRKEETGIAADELRNRLEGGAARLCEMLYQPPELVEDATRRESLRRLSNIMHRINGPVGRASRVIEDLIEFLKLNPEMSQRLLPSDMVARERADIIEEDIENHTFRMKLTNLSRAIDELRHLSYKVRRLKTLQGDLPKQDIDVLEVLRQLADGFRSQLPSLRIDFVFPEEAVIIPFNRDAFKDALDEVFQNACREFREHNTDAPHLILRVENSGSQVEISITDNALPVNHALIEHPFEEDASTYARSGRGSGLGLFNVRETFRIVAGECRLTENRDQQKNRLPGASFTVKIDIQHSS